MGEMPVKTVSEIKAECLRIMRLNMMTREITDIDLIKIDTSRTGPNWTWKALHPSQPPAAETAANEIIKSVAGRWAMAD